MVVMPNDSLMDSVSDHCLVRQVRIVPRHIAAAWKLVVDDLNVTAAWTYRSQRWTTRPYPIRGAEDFQISEDGKPQEVSFFEQSFAAAVGDENAASKPLHIWSPRHAFSNARANH